MADQTQPPPLPIGRNSCEVSMARSDKNKIVIGVIIVCLILITGIVEQKMSPRDSTVTNPVVNQSFIKRSGEIAVLKDNSLISINEEAENELTKFVIAKNTESISRMILSGRVAMAPAGMRVTIIKAGWDSSYIEVMDGPGAGARGWLINSMMR
ncbi:MAG: hypothetical protein AB9917_13860 [Negativicutes bacterium]